MTVSAKALGAAGEDMRNDAHSSSSSSLTKFDMDMDSWEAGISGARCIRKHQANMVGELCGSADDRSSCSIV